MKSNEAIVCLRYLALLFTLGGVLALPVGAQINTASLTGQVMDANGAATSGATVTAKNNATNVAQSVVTDAAGNYIFVSLPVGTYSVSVEATGFKKSVNEKVTLEVAQKARLDFTLQVGRVEETITVEANGALLTTQEATPGAVVENKLVTDLPLSARNWDDLLLTVAGVQGDRYTEEGGGTASGRTGNVNVNGARSLQNNFVLDGADNNSISENVQELTTQVIRPSVEAIREFKVMTNPYNAEYGRSPGAAISVTTKGGSNQLHGSLYEFHRNRVFDANNFFVNSAGRDKPQQIQNQFGGALGGPVLKDKLFFFGDYEGTRIRKGLLRLTNVPLPNERIGDFSLAAAALARVKYQTNCPGGAQYCYGTVMDPLTGRPFPDNKIPADRIEPIARRVLDLIPQTNLVPGAGALNANNYIITPNLQDDTDSYLMRGDWQIGARHNAFARYAYTDRFRYVPGFLGGIVDGTSTSAWGRLTMIAHSAVVGVNSVISPKLVNEFRLGWGRNYSRGVQDPYGKHTLSEFGFKGIPDNPLYDGGIVGISIGGGGIPSPASPARLGSPNFLPKWQFTNQYQWYDAMSLTVGKHQLRFGSDLRAPMRNLFLDVPAMRGEIGFNGQFTGNGYGDFLLGYVQGAQTSVFHEVDQRLWMWSGFVQDDWKVSSRLTLNLGLRYDFATWPYEAKNQMANLDLQTGQLVFAKDGSLSERTLIKSDKNNFAPRIGVAWSLDNRTVIRAGYGRFYQLFERYGSEDQLALNPPFLLNAQETTSSRTQPAFFLKDGFPAKYRDPANIDLRRIRLRAVNPDAVMPETDQWNFGVQRLLPSQMVLTLDYVGTKGTHLSILRNPNFIPGQTGTAARVFQNLGDVELRENAANSNYNGLNATLEKRYSAGLSFRMAYTYSKAIDVAGQPLNSGGSTTVQDPLRFLALRGLSDYDYRHRFVTAVVYDLPFGRGKSLASEGVAGWILGGWRASGIFTRRSGRPFSVTAGENGGFVGSFAAPQANRIADGRLDDDQRSINRWFDASAFVAPKTPSGQPTFGNAGRGILIGPGLTNFDFALARNFNFTESKRLEFRWEAFNLFNTPQFGLPASNISSPSNVGRITTLAGDPRVMQFALKLVF
ncbi:MAG TPA: TonB-dependent receptor [Blastocatellia bacterium]|nr:TonB-dependent receptor [Blastocatellia bacterium]